MLFRSNLGCPVASESPSHIKRQRTWSIATKPHQDGKTMMSVPKNVHSVRNGGVHHTGGRAVITHNKNNPLNQLNYPSPEERF